MCFTPPFLFPPQIHFSWQRPRLLHPMHSCPSQCWLNLVKDAVSETAKTPFCLLSWCRTALKIQQQSLSPGHAIVSVEAHCTSSCSPHTGSVPMGRQCQSDTPLVPSALAVSTSASQTTLYQSEAKLGQGRFLLTASHPFANIRTHTCDLHAHGCTYKYIKMYQYTYTKAYLCLLLLFAFSQHLQFRLPSIITYKSIWPISLHAHVHIYTCTHVGVAAQKQETFQKNQN